MPRQPQRSAASPAGTAADTLSDLAGLLREVARLHVRAQRQLVARSNVNVSHCTVLTELARESNVSLGALSSRLRVDKGWVSRVVDRMVDDGLVVRDADPSDARAVVISTTSAGRRLHERIERLLDAQVTRVVGAVPKSNHAALRKVLAQLADAYHVELNDPEP